jgi:hypothetical protein
MAKKKGSFALFRDSDEIFEDLHELPRLVLATSLEYNEVKEASSWSPVHWTFKPKRTWLYLKHETGGKAHNSVYLIATVLKP